ncbi:VOC family protein [Aquincola sp. S2]|uniref:VOC family protein n=1 Tax=Pseudaquabacterium terrae TaxID=2732868 RepID=A0ABX2EI45_9BURK|nr:VOC family protein [Aquabacterium terrae]NRF68278.1 VOC family protein [Aquabacterium terrae]
MSRLQSSYPLITTPRHFACRDFYVRHFGFEVGFEASWFILLTQPPGDGSIALAFMHPEHPSSPPGPDVFDGRGMLLTLQVDDAEAESRRLAAAGVPISYALHRERWGQLRFQVIDPAGLVLDIVEQVEPDAGFWEAWPAPVI